MSELSVYDRLGRIYDPTYFMPPASVVLICDEEEAAKLLPLIDDERRPMWPTGDSAAITWQYRGEWGVSIDAARLISDSYGLEDILSALTHEAYHIAHRHLRDDLGEENPAEEEIAYHVEGIACSLFEQFFEWLEKQ